MPTLRVPAGALPALRCYLTLTQTHLATLMGTTRGVVAQAEAGTRFLTAEAREALSALLAALPLATRQALAIAPGHVPPPLPPRVPAPHVPLPRPLTRRRHLATQELDRVLAALGPLEARRLASAARLALLAAPACPPPWPRMGSLPPRPACGPAPLPRPSAACCGLRPPACGPSWRPWPPPPTKRVADARMGRRRGPGAPQKGIAASGEQASLILVPMQGATSLVLVVRNSLLGDFPALAGAESRFQRPTGPTKGAADPAGAGGGPFSGARGAG